MQANVQNKTPSIIKFISKLAHKKDKQITAVPLSSEQTSFKSNVAAEKRNCSDSDESSVKRLKLEDNPVSVVDSQQKRDNAMDSDGCQDKENKIICITLE